jgi:hypothetical protein
MKLPFDSDKSKTGYGVNWRAMKWYYIAVLTGIGVIILIAILFSTFQK